MRLTFSAFLLFAAAVLQAADFQSFQAARAVIGQPSFSARDKGMVPLSLSLAKGNLYVADVSGHVLTYDVSQIGQAKSAGCPVCLVTPLSTIQQSVFAGVAAVAVYGNNIVIADSKAHRVMIWNGISPTKQPDVVLSAFKNPTSVAIDSKRLFVGDAATHHVFVWNALPTSDSQAPDVTLGANDSVESVGPDSIQTPAALASDGVNLFVADSGARRVLVFSPADSGMPQVLNAATLVPGPLAPGTLVSIEQAAAGTATVFLNGNSIPVTDVNGDQLQVQIPYDLSGASAGSLWIKNERDGGAVSVSAPVALHFASASPGIFAFGATEPRTGLLLHAQGNVPLSPEDGAKPAEVLCVWATGLGAVSAYPNSDGAFETVIPVRATVNGNPVDVLSAVLPADATGVYEVRLRLPAQVPANAALVVFQNDARSNAVTFPIALNPK